MNVKIIAELCQNHNGNENLIFDMLNIAAESGATHVKLQHIFAKNLTYRSQFEQGGVDPISGANFIKRPYAEEYSRLHGLEVSASTIKKFINEANRLNIIPLTTCFCTEHIEELVGFGFTEIKVASYDCASLELLKRLRNKFDHVYLSTGASFNSEIERAAKVFEGLNFTMLHCVTRYPTPLEHLNIKRLKWLSNLAPNVGYSDHSRTSELGIYPSCLAIDNGATCIERHFSILDEDQTKDGIVSINQSHLSKLVDFVNMNSKERAEMLNNSGLNLAPMLGDGEFRMSKEEYSNRLYYRGRFASYVDDNSIPRHIYNWEYL